MKSSRGQGRIWILAVILAFSGVDLLTAGSYAQIRSGVGQTTVAHDRGYSDGYDDGYGEGKGDYNRNAARDHTRSQLYRDADRGYESRLGSLADYREGYRIGFEIGYTDGYYGRTANKRTPRNALGTTLRKRVRPRPDAGSVIPDGTTMRLRLTTALSTKTNQEGDTFTARVIDPPAYEGATVEGHIARIERSGKLTGRTEMALDFDAITLRNGARGPFYAQIEKIFIGDSIKTADNEGNIESANKTRDILIRAGGGAALGAIIGAIAKGSKGAIIGAIIGAGVGAGSVFIQGDKDLILDNGTEMSVRTTSTLGDMSRQ